MFLETVERTKDRGRFAAPLVVCGRAHIAHVAADPAAAGIGDALIIVEPAARTTAPATAPAALAAVADHLHAMLPPMPSAHVMPARSASLAAHDSAWAPWRAVAWQSLSV